MVYQKQNKKKAQNEYQGESHLHATAFVLF